ncbi:hypothetical protein NC653_033096 [Populus alba x Populus x berolinensis]|uniref:Uncharacterized protein n=1 Tax=Populus alba x Populus x berolinensis TaxID=444605 RepID=A0AAD6LU24_9ROSI|nr:hypothetical protein NC653_033096 [Populus alba x Populus x berolinensis]
MTYPDLGALLYPLLPWLLIGLGKPSRTQFLQSGYDHVVLNASRPHKISTIRNAWTDESFACEYLQELE